MKRALKRNRFSPSFDHLVPTRIHFTVERSRLELQASVNQAQAASFNLQFKPARLASVTSMSRLNLSHLPREDKGDATLIGD